jgi:hypothetical protein
VNVDFKKFATQRDLDETKGHAPEKKIGPLQFRDLRSFKNKKFEGGENWKQIPGDDGSALEDAFGVTLFMHLTKVFTVEEIHVGDSLHHFLCALWTYCVGNSVWWCRQELTCRTR